MSVRALRAAVVLLLALASLSVAAPVMAVEDAPAPGEEVEPEPTSLEEVRQDNEVVQEYLPEPFEQPTVFRPIVPVLLAMGLIISLIIFGLFLLWQPRFAQERAAKAKSKGKGRR